VGRQRVGAQAGDDLHRRARRGLVMAAVVIGRGQRHRHRRQAQEAAFHRRGDGARIDHVVAHVGDGVDAGNDDVGFHVQHAAERHVHAVGGRAVHPPGGLVEAGDPHRHVQGQRVARAGTVAVGRDHQHFVSGLAQPLGEDADAGRVDAVVVADQYAHETPLTERQTWGSPG
ncbi:hypothetical protein CATMIT_01937, partial [Catenibacterium mitsuokai DSM 15897]